MRYFRHFCKVFQLLSLHTWLWFCPFDKLAWKFNTWVQLAPKFILWQKSSSICLVLNWTCECIACAFLEFWNFEIAFFWQAQRKFMQRGFCISTNFCVFWQNVLGKVVVFHARSIMWVEKRGCSNKKLYKFHFILFLWVSFSMI